MVLGSLFFALALSCVASAATVNFVQQSVNDADGSTITGVASDQWIESAATYTTVTAPETSGTYRFTHWTISSEPSGSHRDAWGRSQNPISVTIYENTTATAHYLPATLDSDGDGVPDWYEMEYYGTLANGATSDTDGDGFSLLHEYTSGSHPLYANANQAGGVAYADSGMVTVNLAGYSRYTLSSSPAGTVNESAVVATGTVVATPNLTDATFGYWTLDGVPQRDAWGIALRQFSFTMASSNREAVAYFFTGDSDDDTVPDAWEYYYYGTLVNNAPSDTDGDGLSMLAEYGAGTSPVFGNSVQDGGVAYADSASMTVNLAGFSRYTLRSEPAGTVSQSAVVADGTVVTTDNLTQATFAYWLLDGVRQQDAWGVALRQLSFTINGTDREAVAVLLSSVVSHI